MTTTHRIAMWSGPRNISTAMMRSWDARGDAAVCDEPLYAHYLEATGHPHPGADEVMSAHETDWRAVVDVLTGPIPGDQRVYYQKHMAHHLLPGIELDWLDLFVNCFLIRDPAEMITSLSKVIEQPTIDQTGLPQQLRLFDHVRRRRGAVPPVIDSKDVLTDPARILGRLCEAVGVPWTDRMLAWEPGPRATDGVWAPHWYDSVWKSTGFAPYRPKTEPVPDRLEPLYDEARPLYDLLHPHRLT